MSNKIFNAVAVITLLILAANLGVSAYAFAVGKATYAEFLNTWREPLAVCLGYWLRGTAAPEVKQ